MFDKVSSWISAFHSNFRKRWLKGPLNTNDFLKQRKFIIRKVQLHYSDTQMFKINQIKLYVKVSEEGLYQCFSKILVGYLIFIPQRVSSNKKISWRSSDLNIYGGVTLIKAKIRSEYRIPVYDSWWKKQLRNVMFAKDLMLPISGTINRIVASRTHHFKITIQNYRYWLRRSIIM